MSYIDAPRKHATDAMRRVYYFKMTSQEQTFYISDKLPQGVPIRISATAVVTSTRTQQQGSNRYCELRLQGACSMTQVESSNPSVIPDDSIILAQFEPRMDSTSGATILSFYTQSSVPVTTKLLNNGPWKFSVIRASSGTSIAITYCLIALAIDIGDCPFEEHDMPVV